MNWQKIRQEREGWGELGANRMLLDRPWILVQQEIYHSWRSFSFVAIMEHSFLDISISLKG